MQEERLADPGLFRQFIINASQPASDKIFDVSAFEKFLHDKIKVDNRVGNLGDTIVISQQGDGKIEVIAHTQFSGRYLKYLLVSLPFISSMAVSLILAILGPRNSSRSSNCGTGYVLSLHQKVSTSLGSLMWSMMMPRTMMSRGMLDSQGRCTSVIL